ncbi:MAG: family transporter [Candidatus Angelobacter sp.]|nr:family transporter [Candidatus Angelobacter sp.]
MDFNAKPPNGSNRPIARAALVSIVAAVVLGTGVAIALVLIKAYAVILTFFAAVVLGEATRPLVDRLSTRAPRDFAVALVFTGILAAIGLAWGIPIRVLAPQFVAFWHALPTYLADVTLFLRHLSRDDPRARVLTGASETLSAPIVPFVQEFLRAESGVVTLISTLALVLLMAVFWLQSSDALRAFLLTLVQPNRRASVDSLFREMGNQLGAYVKGTLVNGAIVGTASIIVLSSLRTPYPIVLGLLQGLLVAIPYLGTLIGVLTVGAVVLAAQGWLSAAVAMASIALIASLEGSFVAPLVFKKRLDIDPLSTTLAVAVGGTLFGIGGVVLAVPAATVLESLVVRVIAPAIRSSHVDR